MPFPFFISSLNLLLFQVALSLHHRPTLLNAGHYEQDNCFSCDVFAISTLVFAWRGLHPVAIPNVRLRLRLIKRWALLQERNLRVAIWRGRKEHSKRLKGILCYLRWDSWDHHSKCMPLTTSVTAKDPPQIKLARGHHAVRTLAWLVRF